ncbi:MAG TPA: 4Fe-4S binding protein [Chloroflexota bacterium]
MPAPGGRVVQRKKAPRLLAVINPDGCTGCEACICFCPVDCIHKVPGPEYPGLYSKCEIDLERCIGCALCEKNCPWDAIVMLPTAEVEAIVGPIEFK